MCLCVWVRVTDLVLIGHYLSCSLTYSLTNMASLSLSLSTLVFFQAQANTNNDLNCAPRRGRCSLTRQPRFRRRLWRRVANKRRVTAACRALYPGSSGLHRLLPLRRQRGINAPVQTPPKPCRLHDKLTPDITINRACVFFYGGGGVHVNHCVACPPQPPPWKKKAAQSAGFTAEQPASSN